MQRTFAVILAALAAAAPFGGLGHAVLVAAHVSEPAATTVYGPAVRSTPSGGAIFSTAWRKSAKSAWVK